MCRPLVGYSGTALAIEDSSEISVRQSGDQVGTTPSERKVKRASTSCLELIVGKEAPLAGGISVPDAVGTRTVLKAWNRETGVERVQDVFVVAGDGLRIRTDAVSAHQRVLASVTGNEEGL